MLRCEVAGHHARTRMSFRTEEEGREAETRDGDTSGNLLLEQARFLSHINQYFSFL